MEVHGQSSMVWLGVRIPGQDTGTGHVPMCSRAFPAHYLFWGQLDLSVGMTVLLIQGEVAPRHNVTPR